MTLHVPLQDERRADERARRAASPTTGPTSSLIARARQFSSFVLVLGTLNAADEFNPVSAIILQNKDVRIVAYLRRLARLSATVYPCALMLCSTGIRTVEMECIDVAPVLVAIPVLDRCGWLVGWLVGCYNRAYRR